MRLMQSTATSAQHVFVDIQVFAQSLEAALCADSHLHHRESAEGRDALGAACGAGHEGCEGGQFAQVGPASRGSDRRAMGPERRDILPPSVKVVG